MMTHEQIAGILGSGFGILAAKLAAEQGMSPREVALQNSNIVREDYPDWPDGLDAANRIEAGEFDQEIAALMGYM